MTKKRAEDLAELLEKLHELVGSHDLRQYAWVLKNDVIPWFDKGKVVVGDRVRLVKTPDINPETSWGWMHAKHFLVEGAFARVHEVELRDGRASYALLFEDDSYLHYRTGEKIMTSAAERGVYYFAARWVERVDENGAPALRLQAT